VSEAVGADGDGFPHPAHRGQRFLSRRGLGDLGVQGHTRVRRNHGPHHRP
jgi:hypothetical protein